MSNSNTDIVAVVCTGGCSQGSEVDLKALEAGLKSDGLVGKVVTIDKPCAGDGAARLPSGTAGRAVFAGCPFLHESGWYDCASEALSLHPGEYRIVDAKGAVYDLHPSESTDALRAMLNAAAQVLIGSEAYEETTVTPEPRVLVLGSGLSGLRAALAAATTGSSVDVAELGEPNLSPGCLGSAMDHPNLLSSLRANITSGAEAVFVPFDGSSLSAGSEQGFELRLIEGEARSYGAVVFAPERIEKSVEQVGALTLTQIFSLIAARETLKGTTLFLLDQGGNTSAEVFADVLQAATEIKRRHAGDVHVLMTHARVSATGVEERYDACREAGIVFTRIGDDLSISSSYGDFTIGGTDLATGAAFVFNEPNRVIIPGPSTLSPQSLRIAADLELRLEGASYSQANSQHLLSASTNRPGVFVAGSARADMNTDLIEIDANALAGALAEWLQPQKVPEHIPVIDADRCVYCLTCLRVCPYGAMRTDPGTRAARIVDGQCKACGSCAAECPAEAIRIRNLDNNALNAALRSAAQGG